MSHFDDIDFLFWGDSPKTVIGAVLFLLVAGGAVWWALSADAESEAACVSHGEKYVDSRESYTLCEQDGGTVVRR
jgi:hypothetical protein